MKKMILTFAFAGALLLGGMSCSNSAKDVNPAALTDSIASCTDQSKLESFVKQAKDYADRLVKEGKLEEAQNFLAKIEPVVKEKAPALESTLATVNAAIAKVKGIDAEKEAKEAKEAAEKAAKEAAESAKEQAKEAADSAKEQVKEAAESAKKAAADKVSDAAQKVSNKAKDLLN